MHPLSDQGSGGPWGAVRVSVGYGEALMTDLFLRLEAAEAAERQRVGTLRAQLAEAEARLPSLRSRRRGGRCRITTGRWWCCWPARGG